MSSPRVSIGMPVFNGERYVANAIESVLAQTYSDIELIISDNGSNDRTERICREYAAKDSRVRYYRSDENRGAAWNHNRLVELARGEYFKWQCHDDLCAPRMVETCVAELDRDPQLVLCYGQFVRIDADGAVMGTKSSIVQGMDPLSVRFRSLIHRRDSCEEIYGVMRTAVARQTSLIGPYSNSDDIFLAEMILRGKFAEVSQPLFYYRLHRGQSTKAYKDRLQRMAWFDPSRRGRIVLPSTIVFRAYLSAIRRAPLRLSERLRCYAQMANWAWRFRFWLYGDLDSIFRFVAIPLFRRYVPWSRPIWHQINRVLMWTTTQLAKVYRPKRPNVPWEVRRANDNSSTIHRSDVSGVSSPPAL